MKIVLVFPPLYGVDMPPLGLAYIAAQLQKDGHVVKVLCFNSDLYHNREDCRFLWDWDKSGEWTSVEGLEKYFNVRDLIKQWGSEILGHGPDIVGFSINSHSRLLADLLADHIKNEKKNVPVIFGGPWCTELMVEKDFNKNVDVYVMGEGEGIASNLTSVLADGKSVKDINIKGTIVNTGDGFRNNGWNDIFLDINSIPFPALQLFDLSRYTNKSEIPILFSRGCDYNCRFCTDKPMWGRHRMRDADNIKKEMVKHSELFGKKKFKCNDLMLNGDTKAIFDLSEDLTKNNLQFEWGGMARACPDMTPEILYSMKKGGCGYLTYGIESGAKEVLRHMGKPSKKVISQTFKNTHRAGIKVNTLWMVGYPTERWRDLIETMVFLLAHKKYIDEFVSVSCCYIPRQSWLGRNQDSLNIQYDSNSDWYIQKKNTILVRKFRKKLLLDVARLLRLYNKGIN